MNKMWKLLSEARDACFKIRSSQKITSSELESVFKIYWYENKEEDISSAFEIIVETVNYVVENMLLDFLTDGLKNWKWSFANILVDDILNWWTTLKSIIDDPCSFLSNNIKIKDREVRETLNDLLKEKIKNELNVSDSPNFKSLDISDLQNISGALETVDYLEEDTRNNVKSAISIALYWKASLELEKVSEKFRKDITEATNNWNPTFDAKLYKEEFIDKTRELENDKIVRGTPAENLLQECKLSFESEFDKSLSKLINVIIEWKLADELDNFNNEWEIDSYIESSNSTAYANINRLINEINKKETKDKFNKELNNKIKAARLICKSKAPKVKIITDETGNQYAVFKTEEFPIAHRKEKKCNWKIEPKRLSNGNVLITFKDLTSGKVLEPNDSKRLRSENPYELTTQEWKELENQIKESNKLLREIENIKQKLQTTTDEAQKNELKKKFYECIEKIPHFIKVRNKLKIFNKFMWDYIQDKVPDFDPDTIKITPDIMENLREMAECAKTMLLWQKDALIIEWEAWVWKNVLIDIFAHFTNRPVFVFACGKKTDWHDLTYQWVLDENGSKKLNSKIYEAINTPWAILVLDEINTLDAWVIKMLNGLFDKRKTLVSPEAWGGDAKSLPDVLLFGTMNPVGYWWTQQLPQDVDSRFHHIIHDYDRMFNKEWWVSYSDALRTYWNVNYFWKIVSWNGMRKEEVELYEQALLDKKMWNKLSKKKQEILERFKPISDADFIRAWNQLFIAKNERKVVEEFWLTFVEGMKDIYTIVLFSNYIRMRHKIKQFGIESNDLPRSSATDDLFEEKSFSPRLAIQALEQLNNGNEISSAKQSVIQTYVQQISNVGNRAKIAQFLEMMSNEILEEQLKNKEVQKILFAQKPDEVN